MNAQATKRANTSENQHKQKILINIDQVFFVFTNLDNLILPKLIKKIQDENPLQFIAGVISGKAYSYPVISLKEQEFYFELDKCLKSEHPSELSEDSSDNPYKDTPLLFASFAQNNNENECVSFNSKVYIYNEESKYFQSYPYEIINFQNFQYSSMIVPISNKIDNNIELPEFEPELLKLKEEITINMDTIKNELMKKLRDYKKKVNRELENYDILKKRLLMYSSIQSEH